MTITLTPKTFKFVNSSKSKDKTRPHLCRLVTMTAGVAATDGHRLHWVGEIGEPVSASTETSAKGYNTNRPLPLTDPPPPYTQVIPKTFESEIKLTPKDLDRFNGIEDVEVVIISWVGKKSLQFESHHAFFGPLCVRIDIAGSITDRFEPFAVSSNYLMDAIGYMGAVSIKVGGPLDPLLIEGYIDGRPCHALVMPRRI